MHVLSASLNKKFLPSFTPGDEIYVTPDVHLQADLHFCLYVGRKEGNVLFNNALNIFYLWLYGIRHMVKDYSDSERGNLLLPHGLLFPINSKDSLYAPSHRQDNTNHSPC